MPIPTGGAWPPPHIAPAYQAYRDWDAWYAGDPDRLRTVYAGRGATGESLPPSQRTLPGQARGGVLGKFSRWLWGAAPPPRSRDGRLHIPLPADLAATAANLIFAEAPKFTSTDKAIQARLDTLVEDGLNSLLLGAAEAASVLGDVYLRPVIDRDVYSDRAILTAVHADGAIPTIRWGKLLEVTFWQVLEQTSSVTVRLLEHHDVVTDAAGARHGRITYALHVGNATELGRAVPLTEHPSAAHFAEGLAEDGSWYTKLDRLDVVRVANAGPQRRWRTNGTLKYLGRSDFDQNEPIFDRLDETWTSWMRDIHLAKGRITAPEYMLESLGQGNGAVFDADREVYSAITSLASAGQAVGQQLTISQFAIRHVEHKATGDALTEVAMRHAGLSGQTLGEEGEVAITATESVARERMSFVTRDNRIEGAWRPGSADAVELILAYERAHFGGPAEQKPLVEFADSVSESPETTARTVQLLSAAKAASTKTLVAMVHRDWTDKQVDAEVLLINPPMEDPSTFTGGNDDDPPPGGRDDGDPEGELPPA